MAAAKKVLPEAFDETKLADLEEPITVTVHQQINGRPMPMSLPVKPGEEASGTGWTREEVRQLDEFLVPFFGGGDFRCAATGSNGAQMRWQAYFPIDRYPARPMAATPAPAVVQQPAGNGQLGGPGVVMVTPPTPSYMPPPAWMQGATPVVPPVQQQQVYPQFAQGYPQQQQGGLSVFDPVARRNDELRTEREARLALEAQIKHDRLEASHAANLAALTQELRRVQEQVQVKPQAESAELLAVRAELAALQKAREDDKLAQMIREIQSSTQTQITALTQMIQQQQQAMTAALAAKPAGPDPVLQMMIESTKAQSAAQLEIARLQADASKETARLQAEAAREAARTAIGPREMIDLVAKMSGGQDQLTAGYTRLLESQAHVFENMLNAQGPQTHPALEMVSQGMQGIMGTAQRYIEMKEKASLGQSQAIAMTAQAQAMVAQQRGLAGAPEMAPDGRAPVQTAPPAQAVAAEVEDDEEDDDSPEALEEMEQQLFGPALDAVRRLRQGVKSKILPPEQAAAALLKGMDHFAKQGEPIPAFAFWQQNDLVKLVNILIPDELPSYKEQLIGVLFEARKNFK